MSRLPMDYIPHGGGPCFFMDWNPHDTLQAMADFLKGIASRLPEPPKAILLVLALGWRFRSVSRLATSQN
jgi:hypothetical protein